MKKIIMLSVFLSFIGGNVLASSICNGDPKSVYNCIIKNLEKNQGSSGKYTFMGQNVKFSLKIVGNNIVYDTTNLGYNITSSCNIPLTDKSKLISVLKKNANGSFSTSDMNFANCKTIEGKNDKKEKKQENIDLSGYKILKSTNNGGLRILEKNGKCFLWEEAFKGMKMNGKSDVDKIGEVPAKNCKSLKFFGNREEYLIDLDYLYAVDSNFGKQNIIFFKKELGDIDYNTIKNIGSRFYKDSKNVYFINYDRFNKKLTIKKIDGIGIDIKTFKNIGGVFYGDNKNIYILAYDRVNKKEKVKKIDGVDRSSFRYISGKGEDKNNYYMIDDIGDLIIEKKKNLIKKENVSLGDFNVVGEFDDNGYLKLNFTTKVFGDFNVKLRETLSYFSSDIITRVITNGEGEIWKKYSLGDRFYALIYKKGLGFKGSYVGAFIIDVINDNGKPKILIKKIYVDPDIKQRYIHLINKKFWKRIGKVSYKKRKYVAGKVDKLLDKIANSKRYDNKKKIKKSSLFAAFKEVLLKK